LILLVSLACRFLIPESGTTTPPSGAPPTPASPASPASPVPPVLTTTPTVPTETPSPTSLNQKGPYILYQSDGFWISNPDGSFLTQLTKLQSDNLNLHRAISPSGDRLVMVVTGDTGLDLVQVAIPSGETKTIAHLLDIPSDELGSRPTSAKAFADYAITGYDSFAWQPGGGQLLAFMGATKAPTSDLYTYDTQTGKIA
jgi:hypothetical protein